MSEVVLLTRCGCSRVIDISGPEYRYDIFLPLWAEVEASMAMEDVPAYAEIKTRRFTREELLPDGMWLYREA